MKIIFRDSEICCVDNRSLQVDDFDGKLQPIQFEFPSQEGLFSTSVTASICNPDDPDYSQQLESQVMTYFAINTGLVSLTIRFEPTYFH
jgi:hypothetical protein